MDGNENMHNTHDNITKPDNTYLLKLSLNQKCRTCLRQTSVLCIEIENSI